MLSYILSYFTVLHEKLHMFKRYYMLYILYRVCTYTSFMSIEIYGLLRVIILPYVAFIVLYVMSTPIVPSYIVNVLHHPFMSILKRLVLHILKLQWLALSLLKKHLLRAIIEIAILCFRPSPVQGASYADPTKGVPPCPC